MRFYRIEGRPLTRWGDYGDALQHGMTAHVGRVAGLLSLERTGPYLPPITFPGVGDVVVSSAGRELLETSGLTGFSFQLVNKTRIVDLRWDKWDLKSDEPLHLPDSGEPEGYVLALPPSNRASREMGNVWELVVPISARIGRPRQIVETIRELYLEINSWNGADLFRGDGYSGLLVTERARAWFDEHFGIYTQCEEFACR